ncbi:hypothetical protein PIB30_023726 [Stylosanthes scabra]|uniref:Aminotransferase-like plant mobile domain-containing protein n=1 Tax=Stylosanthes scabra TaxID=79078 RepID=A0ABU6V7P7_9FABA|nr:hypothetical protein [Stylosanthes scabra]
MHGNIFTVDHRVWGATREVQVRRHTRAYIMLLLSTQLFEDKTVARVPVRWIPFVDQLDDLGKYSWGSATLAWLYRKSNIRNMVTIAWTMLDRITHREFVYSSYMTPEVAFVAHLSRYLAGPGSRTIGRYLRWWYLAGRKFLAPEDALYARPPDEIPLEVTQRVFATPPQATQVDDVPNNRRAERRRMVGTRITDRD